MRNLERGDIRRSPKGRSNADKIRGAADVKRRIEWLRRPLVYWAGSPPALEFQKDAAFRPILELVASRLKGFRPGVYSVRLEFQGALPPAELPMEKLRERVNPEVVEIIEVTEDRIAAAAHALKAAGKYPKAMKKLVDGVEAWRSFAEGRLESVRAALSAVRRLKDAGPELLAIEENCLWVGPDTIRPSRALKTDDLRSWIEKNDPNSAHGRKLASIVLGQRRTPCRLPDDLRAWWTCGSLLSSWPADLISRVAGSPLLRILRSLDKDSLQFVNSEAGAVSILELVFVSDCEKLDHVLPLLTALIKTLEGAFEEYPRRLAIMVNLVREAQRIVPELMPYRRAPRSYAPLIWYSLAFDLAYCGYLSPELRTGAEAKFKQVGRDIDLDREAVAGLADVFDAVSMSLLGTDFPASFWDLALLPERQSVGERSDLLDRILHSPEPLTGRDREAWRATFVGFAARAFALCGSSEIVMGMTSWLDACRREFPPGIDGAGAVWLASRSLECWMEQAGGDPANISTLGRLLSGHGRHLLKRHVRRTIDGTRWVPRLKVDLLSHESWYTDLADSLWVLGRLGPLSAEEAEAVVKGKLLGDVKAILLKQPERLREYVGFVRKADRARLAAGGERRHPGQVSDDLLSIFEAKRDKILLRLTGWLTSRARSTGTSPAVVHDVYRMMIEIIKNRRTLEDFVGRSFEIWEKMLLKETRFLEELRWDCEGMILLANEWARQGFPDPVTVFERLLDRYAGARYEGRCGEAVGGEDGVADLYLQNLSDDHVVGVVQIAGGSVDRLIRLLDYRLPRGVWTLPEDPNRGWAFLKRFEGAQNFLRSCLDRKEWVGRVIGYLQRLALAVRFQTGEGLGKSYDLWQDPEIGGVPISSDAVLPELRRKIAEIVAYKKIAGEDAEIPVSIDKILKMPVSRRTELEKLKERELTGTLTGSMEKRLEGLRDDEREPGRLASRINADLRRAVKNQLIAAKFAALEAGVSGAIREFWSKVLPGVAVSPDDEDWDNALRLYLDMAKSRNKNRRLLNKLMRNEARGDRGWVDRLSQNQAFRAKMEGMGVDMGAWLGKFEKALAVGSDTWTLYAETDPLRVLQMGNLFDTCLKTGSFNSFATVANAVEVNKRVLFIRNGRGVIIGRKLIGLGGTKEGGVPRAVLIGFHSYGSTDEPEKGSGRAFRSPWVKVLFDLGCLEIAGRIHAGFESDPERLQKLSEKLPLFAAWYNDGPELFDWWVTEASPGCEALGSGGREELLKRIWEEDHKDHRAATLRALLWLGEDALPIMKSVGEGAFQREDLSLVRRFSQSGAVRKLAAGWLMKRGGEGGGK